jgi:uncharacterized protein (DUF362 family)
MEFPQAGAHYFVESRPGVPDTESADRAVGVVPVADRRSMPRLQLTTAPVATSRQPAVSAEIGMARPPSEITAETRIAARPVLPLTES